MTGNIKKRKRKKERKKPKKSVSSVLGFSKLRAIIIEKIEAADFRFCEIEAIPSLSHSRNAISAIFSPL